jgi:hypothetical protein
MRCPLKPLVLEISSRNAGQTHWCLPKPAHVKTAVRLRRDAAHQVCLRFGDSGLVAPFWARQRGMLALVDATTAVRCADHYAVWGEGSTPHPRNQIALAWMRRYGLSFETVTPIRFVSHYIL